MLTCECTEIDRELTFPAWQNIKHAVNITRLESGGIESVISEQQQCVRNQWDTKDRVGTVSVQHEECGIMEADEADEADEGDVFHDQGSLDRGGEIGGGDGQGHGGCNGQLDRVGDGQVDGG